MNPILKISIVTSLICFSLYIGFAGFLGSTTELHDSLDMKSLGYVLPENSDDNPKPSQKLDPLPKPDDKEDSALDRGEDVLIDVKTVFARSRKADNEVVKLSVAEADDDARYVALSTETRLKQTLGISEPLPPVRAVDVALEIPSDCDANDIVLAPLTVKYRHESPSIKGDSLGDLKLLVAEYRKCDGAVFHLSHNPLGKEDSTPALMQRRMDELKYFFLQHTVPKTAMRFPEIHD